jgi:hypothetical protein
MEFVSGTYLGLWGAIAACIAALLVAIRAVGRARRATEEADALRKELEALRAIYDEECKWRLAVENYDTDILPPRGLRGRSGPPT